MAPALSSIRWDDAPDVVPGTQAGRDLEAAISEPGRSCKPPRIERKEMRVLDMAATAALIEFARGGRLHMPVLLFTLCGLRRAEVAALRWNRLDLDAGRLSVLSSIEQTDGDAREAAEERPSSVGHSAWAAVEELRKHRVRQAEYLLRLGVRQSDDTHVCLREDGSPWPPPARICRSPG